MKPDSASKETRTRFGLFVRKERWGLTWRGRLLVTTAFIGLTALVILRVHPFLAVSAPVHSPDLVVEGWIDERALRAGVKVFRDGGYNSVYATGGPTGQAFDSKDVSDTYASVGGHRLALLGIPPEQIKIIPSFVSRRDRTYASAVALREWFRTHGIQVTALDIVTLSVHARRSRLMYEAAFGKDVEIGILAMDNGDYDAKCWWRYSEGIKEVISEGAAYLYARFLFQSDAAGTIE